MGKLNVVRAIENLRDAHGMGNADVVVLTGDSAGGAGVIYNVDMLQSMLPGVHVFANPVGGSFPINAVYSGPESTSVASAQLLDPRSMRSYLRLFNATTTLTPREFARIEVAAPLYPVEYLTDFLTTSLYAGVPLEKDSSSGSTLKLKWISPSTVSVAADPIPRNRTEVYAYLEEYAASVVSLLMDIGAGTAASCYLHTNVDVTWPVVNGATALDGLNRWMNAIINYRAARHASGLPASVSDDIGGVYLNIDQCDGNGYWPPCNPTCPRDAGR